MEKIRFMVIILCLCAVATVAATFEKVSITNKALRKKLEALVVLPQKYRDSTAVRFPVVYLLHGYSGTYASYYLVIDLRKYADQYGMILVCPDGNYNSWYLDSPLRKASKFDTYITSEVVSYIDSCYRTIADMSGRAILGSSMGGHGALTLLARHPDLFCCGSSISAILDLTAFPDKWDIEKVLGPYAKNKEVWAQHSFVTLVENLNDSLGRNKRCIMIDCGTSDFALAVNRSCHKLMEEKHIEHSYRERPGSHSYQYVKTVMNDHMKFIKECMQKTSAQLPK
ncbi:MAG: esterase family protein [Chitinivibrionales bacterium]|nr:esterase family protein [Chitinivibrionales bacterium]